MSLTDSQEWKDLVAKARGSVSTLKDERDVVWNQLRAVEANASRFRVKIRELDDAIEHLEGFLRLLSTRPDLDPERGR